TSPSSRTSLQRVRQSTYPQLTATVPVRSPSHIPLTIKTHLSNAVAVTRLYGDVAGTASAESTSSQLPMLARLSEPVVYRDGRENIILNGNTFGPHAMINIGSHHCTGAGGSFIYLSPNIKELTYFWPLTSYANCRS
ncbi:hypothetical protein CY34DRAFT_814353, partial [Suillus luteus UH-Slu-Lm8-n1]